MPDKDTQKENGVIVFTTNDGWDIFVGDLFWVVDKHFKIYKDICDSMAGSRLSLQHELGDRYFSTEDAAMEYAIQYKPCASLNDLLVGANVDQDITLRNFRELIKQKINYSK